MQQAAVVSKSQFAALVGRHASFVTRAIDEGKIAGEALIGTGRGARIAVEPAKRQLGLSLDPAQQLAQARPILAAVPAPASASHADGDPAETPAAALARQEYTGLRSAKLRADIERAAREDAVAAGQLVAAAAVRRELARQLGPLAAVFDELPPAIAQVVAEQFGLDYPAVLIAIKGAVRSQRTAFADRAASLATPAEQVAA